MPRRGLVPRRWSGAATVAGNRWAGGAVAGRQRPPSGLRGAVCGLGWGVGVVHKVIHRPCSTWDKSTRRPLQLGQSRHIALPTPGALHSTAARPRQHNSREQSFRARKCHTKERRQRVSPVNPWLRFPEEEPNLPTSTVPTHSLWIRFRNSPSPVDNPGYNLRHPLPPHHPPTPAVHKGSGSPQAARIPPYWRWRKISLTIFSATFRPSAPHPATPSLPAPPLPPTSRPPLMLLSRPAPYRRTASHGTEFPKVPNIHKPDKAPRGEIWRRASAPHPGSLVG
ncbi:hypothetical protein SRIMM317S_01530 [Streptomyces rimosus subsp. rimosus]